MPNNPEYTIEFQTGVNRKPNKSQQTLLAVAAEAIRGLLKILKYNGLDIASIMISKDNTLQKIVPEQDLSPNDLRALKKFKRDFGVDLTKPDKNKKLVSKKGSKTPDVNELIKKRGQYK